MYSINACMRLQPVPSSASILDAAEPAGSLSCAGASTPRWRRQPTHHFACHQPPWRESPQVWRGLAPPATPRRARCASGVATGAPCIASTLRAPRSSSVVWSRCGGGEYLLTAHRRSPCSHVSWRVCERTFPGPALATDGRPPTRLSRASLRPPPWPTIRPPRKPGDLVRRPCARRLVERGRRPARRLDSWRACPRVGTTQAARARRYCDSSWATRRSLCRAWRARAP